MFCSRCGSPNDDSAKFCQKCGDNLSADVVAPPAAFATPPQPIQSTHATARGGNLAAPQVGKRYAQGKNVVLAVILSVLIIGVGQFYNGDHKKGAVMLVAAIILVVPTGGLAWLPLVIWSALDAYQVADGKWPLW